MRTEGNVRQRKDGSFEARYKIGRNGRGRTAYASCYGKTLEEAVEKREKALEQRLIENNPAMGLNLLILGAGSHGQEVREIAESLHIFQKIDFLDDDTNKLEAIGSWGDIEELKDDYNMAIVAVGNGRNKAGKEKQYNNATQINKQIGSIVRKGSVLCTVYYENIKDFDKNLILDAFSIK